MYALYSLLFNWTSKHHVEARWTRRRLETPKINSNFFSEKISAKVLEEKFTKTLTVVSDCVVVFGGSVNEIVIAKELDCRPGKWRKTFEKSDCFGFSEKFPLKLWLKHVRTHFYQLGKNWDVSTSNINYSLNEIFGGRIIGKG